MLGVRCCAVLCAVRPVPSTLGNQSSLRRPADQTGLSASPGLRCSSVLSASRTPSRHGADAGVLGRARQGGLFLACRADCMSGHLHWARSTRQTSHLIAQLSSCLALSIIWPRPVYIDRLFVRTAHSPRTPRPAPPRANPHCTFHTSTIRHHTVATHHVDFSSAQPCSAALRCASSPRSAHRSSHLRSLTHNLHTYPVPALLLLSRAWHSALCALRSVLCALPAQISN